MKKLLLLTFGLLFLYACNNDDQETVAICEIPENITVTNITHQSAQLHWEDSNTSANFSLEYGESGFILGNGVTISLDVFEVTLLNLIANTTYDFYIKSVCGATNESMYSEVISFTTLPPLVRAEFLPTLSELNLYTGNLADLNETIYAFNYELITPLFSDYSHKKRFIALPLGESMEYVDDGFPIFPDKTVIAKTFFYNLDERDVSLGRTIIETRVLIKENGNWELGNYKWNSEQTEAYLDDTSSIVPISFIDDDGNTNTIDYEIPSNTDCFTCHSNAGNKTPIGPKLRNINMDNQIQRLVEDQLLLNLTDPSTVSKLPNWKDTSFTLEERARAYFEINCAHCHIDDGYCGDISDLRLSYDTPFADTKIFEKRFTIPVLMQIGNMPFIGTTTVHNEGLALIQEYLDTL